MASGPGMKDQCSLVCNHTIWLAAAILWETTVIMIGWWDTRYEWPKNQVIRTGVKRKHFTQLKSQLKMWLFSLWQELLPNALDSVLFLVDKEAAARPERDLHIQVTIPAPVCSLPLDPTNPPVSDCRNSGIQQLPQFWMPDPVPTLSSMKYEPQYSVLQNKLKSDY